MQLRSRSLVVVPPRFVLLGDSAGIRRHVLPEAVDLDPEMAVFTATSLRPELLELPGFGSVAARPMTDSVVNMLLPDAGTRFSFVVPEEDSATPEPRFTFRGPEPDVVLLLDSLIIGRGFQRSAPSMGGVSVGGVGAAISMGVDSGISTKTLDMEVTFSFWDNREGRLISTGRAAFAQPLSVINKRAYAEAIGRLVYEMAKKSPFR